MLGPVSRAQCGRKFTLAIWLVVAGSLLLFGPAVLFFVQKDKAERQVRVSGPVTQWLEVGTEG
jgi:hypothetical protein